MHDLKFKYFQHDVTGIINSSTFRDSVLEGLKYFSVFLKGACFSKSTILFKYFSASRLISIITRNRQLVQRGIYIKDKGLKRITQTFATTKARYKRKQNNNNNNNNYIIK